MLRQPLGNSFFNEFKAVLMGGDSCCCYAFTLGNSCIQHYSYADFYFLFLHTQDSIATQNFPSWHSVSIFIFIEVFVRNL
jgi:hypothetical protein